MIVFRYNQGVLNTWCFLSAELIPFHPVHRFREFPHPALALQRPFHLWVGRIRLPSVHRLNFVRVSFLQCFQRLFVSSMPVVLSTKVFPVSPVPVRCRVAVRCSLPIAVRCFSLRFLPLALFALRSVPHRFSEFRRIVFLKPRSVPQRLPPSFSFSVFFCGIASLRALRC